MQNNLKPWDFIRMSKYTTWISAFLVIVGLFLVVIRGFSWGVDFAGGTQLRVAFDKSAGVNHSSLGEDFQKFGINPTITPIHNLQQDEFLLYYSKDTGDKQVSQLLEQIAPGKWTILSENFVGSKIGQQFRKIAISSTIVTLVLILLYLAFRFDYRFGIAAVISLVHDIIIVLCLISFIDLSFTIPILAAVLTVVGYSLNDTIVIFDRIRSERSLLGKEFISVRGYYDLVNRSIHKSLTRTFLTSGSTLLVLVIFLSLGGGELRPMAIVLTIGVLFGTVSSNFVAPQFLYLWHKRDIAKLQRQPRSS